MAQRMSNEINEASIVRASQDHLRADLDDATVLLHFGSGQYFSLGGAAMSIWQMLQEPVRVSSLLERLTAQFEVDSERCRQESLLLLRQLHDQGLLTVSSA